MPKPDLEMIHEETGKFYYNGRIFDITRMVDGWTLSRQCFTDRLYTGQSIDDCSAWLMAQQLA